MKKFLIAFATLIIATTLASANTNDTAVGTWLSIGDDGITPTGYWTLYVADNGTLSGKMIYAIGEALDEDLSHCDETYRDYPVKVDFSTQTLIDTILMYNLQFKSEGEWIRGNIIDPDNAKVYYVRVTVDGDTMKMRGSLDKAGWLGRSQNWIRTTEERAIEARDNFESKAEVSIKHSL